MHCRTAHTVIALAVLACAHAAAASTRPLNMVPIERKYLPMSALQEGTLANAALQTEVRGLVSQRLASAGCQVKTLDSYLLKLPYGKTGERRWQELWQAKGCGDGVINTTLTFQERPKKSASISFSEGNDE